MGQSNCCLSDDEREAIRRAKMIDRQLQSEKRKPWNECKVLLLGCGEVGKTTFVKQMRIIYGEDYSEQDRLEFRSMIYHNILKGTKILIEASRRLQIPLQHPQNEPNCQMISAYHREGELSDDEFQPYVEPLMAVWKDGSIQSALNRRNQFQLGDSVPYFANKLDIIGQRGYVPSRKDVLKSRKATRGIHEYVIDIKGLPFRFVDTGGERSQRQKWFQCFDEVTCILLFCASSAFDQTLLEDRITNRIVESLNVFDTIVNERLFRSTPIILCFNKVDLLAEKIKVKNIKDYFPTFEGDPHDLQDVQKFLVSIFDSVRQDRTRPLDYHFITSTSTRNIKHFFELVKDTILTQLQQDIIQL